jgi:hypothetical protein
VGKTFTWQIRRLHDATLAEVQVKTFASDRDAHPGFTDINFHAREKCKLSVETNRHIVLLSKSISFPVPRHCEYIVHALKAQQ